MRVEKIFDFAVTALMLGLSVVVWVLVIGLIISFIKFGMVLA